MWVNCGCICYILFLNTSPCMFWMYWEICAYQEEMLSLYLNNCLVWALGVCILLSIVMATYFYGKSHLTLTWANGKWMPDAVLLKTDKRLFVPFRLLTKVPSVTVMWIFVASLDHRSLYACVAGAQTDMLPQHLSSKKKPEARYILKSIFCT